MSDPFPAAAPMTAPPGPIDLDGEIVTAPHDPPVDAARRRRLVLLVAAAGALVLGGGGAAAVTLFGLPGAGGEPDSVVAAPRPSTSPPGTGQVTSPGDAASTGDRESAEADDLVPGLGRNVFAPLVDLAPEGGGGGDPAPGDAGTGTGATSAPTGAVPTLVETVPVPGPTVTATQVVAGPTVTATATVTATPSYRFVVEVVSVADPASATTAATLRVNGTAQTVAAGAVFGPGGALTYTGYTVGTGQVTVTTGSTAVSLPPGTSVALP
ncbi:MAG: hypothetical protein ACFCVF_11315 [Kineosporiaceae bacterium]